MSLVARGAHLAALAAQGLTVARPDGCRTYALEVAPGAAQAQLADLDAVLLCVKSQDTPAALADLLRAAGPRVPVVCAQNGVDNERLALEQHDNVYGMMVWMPASHLEPGRVANYASEPPAVLRLGRFPEGADELSGCLAAALRDGSFDAQAVEDIDAWKHAKLLLNLGNALDAFCEPVPPEHPFRAALEQEALAVLQAAGRGILPREVLTAATEHMHMSRVEGHKREGGSTWQSAVRGLPGEVEHLNGSLCRLGASHGVPTPLNRSLVELARTRPAPRSVHIDSLAWQA